MGNYGRLVFFTSVTFSAVSMTSIDAEAAFGGAEALVSVALLATMSSVFDVPLCHLCRACVMFI